MDRSFKKVNCRSAIKKNVISPQKMDNDKKPRFRIYHKIFSNFYTTETEKLVALTLTTFFGPNIQELSKFECLEFQGVNIDV